MLNDFLREVGTLNLVDIGCRDGAFAKWGPIQKNINFFGFDLDKGECERLSRLPTDFHSATYLPYGIAGDNGLHVLYKTRSPYCGSLLKPNLDYLRRLSFGNLFEIVGTEEIATVTLDRVHELALVDVDIIKSDTQGLELPILSHAGRILKDVFYVELETIFGSEVGYVGETTFAEMETFMLREHFLLFGIDTDHCVARNNHLRDNPSREQIFYCEAVWLKDYVALHRQGLLHPEALNRPKALKALILCAFHGCISYGFELAGLFRDLGWITATELEGLKRRENWLIKDTRRGITAKLVVEKSMNVLARLLPRSTRAVLLEQARITREEKSLLKFWGS